MASDARRRAMALVMVVMVLAILVVIGTPFAVSMLLQEKSGQSFLADTRARFAAEGARNHAIAQLSLGHDFLERSRNAKAPWNDPYADGVGEMQFDFADLVKLGMPVADPKGEIWGAEVEDEQGKLNKRTTPQRVLQTLDGLLGGNAVAKWHYVTEHSQRAATWIQPQGVRALTLDAGALAITVDNAFALGCAPRIRLTRGDQQLVGTTGEIAQIMDGRAAPFDSPGATVELEAIHPVNPNVAPREVLAAIFTGLAVQTLSANQIQQMLNQGLDVPKQDHVTPAEAMALAVKIVQREQPFQTPRDFFDFVVGEAKAGSISESDASAIYLNSMNCYDGRLVDQDSGAWLGTVPFCYESQNVFLVEATGVANNPAGNEAGKRVVRDVVEVAPAERLTWAVESQYDFDRELWRGQGGRVVSWPERSFQGGDPQALWLGKDQRIPVANIGFKPSLDRADDIGYLTLRAPQDRRDPGNIKWKNSWDDRHEGGEMKGDPLTWDPKDVGLNIPNRQIDIDAGGLEFWVKFDGRPSDTTFLDYAQKAWENRLSFKYDSGKQELVLSVCDACAERKASQVRAPISFDRDTWYHLGAVWKSTKYAELCVFIDGFPKGTFQIQDDKGTNYSTQLTSALSETSTTVAVRSTAGYTAPGAIEVGDEAIEYTGVSGKSFTGCRRGARGTASSAQNPLGPNYTHGHVHDHPAGSGVTPFGYANYLRTVRLPFPAPFNVNFDRIPQVKGSVREDFGADPQGQVAAPMGIRATDTTIIISSSANPPPPNPTQDFPNTGYIQVGTEVVYYGAKASDRFTGCQRGQFGTTAAAWPRGTPVLLWAIPVDDCGGYLDPGIVQIDDEWILGRPEPGGVDGPLIAGFVVNGAAVPLRRGFVTTAPAAHATGAKVIPVFATKDPWCGDTLASGGDVVTIVEANQAGAKPLMKVRHAIYVGQVGNPPVNINIAFCAFDDFTRKTYVNDGVTRLMKFPSDELLSVESAPVTFGADAPAASRGNGGKLVGTIDDLRFFASNKGSFKTEQQVQASDTSLLVTNISSMSPQQGAIKLGDEVIGYVGSAGGGPVTLSNTKRGYLKSPVQGHGTGERFLNLSFMPLTSTAGAIGEKEASILVTAVQGFAPVGFLLIDDEVIGYNDQSNGFNMPTDREGKGIFRGRFGTTVAAHDVGSLVYGIPFRYFDLSRQEAFDNQMAYFQAALHASGAKFGRLRWDEERRRDKAIVRVLARVDGKPGWDERPTNRPGGLYEFTQADGRNAIDASGSELQIQVRYEYQAGAFGDDTWKYSPRVNGIWVEYEQPEVVRSHEEE